MAFIEMALMVIKEMSVGVWWDVSEQNINVVNRGVS